MDNNDFNPATDLFNRDGTLRFGEWDGSLCPLMAGDSNGVCVHHQDDEIPCRVLVFCQSRDGDFSVPEEPFEVPDFDSGL